MLRQLRKPVLISVLLIAGCGGGHHRESEPSGQRADVFECTPPDFPDAVPKREPVSKYGNPETYKVYGVSYRVMKSGRGYRERGIASWYGPDFHGKRTSSGEQYDMHQMTAAHKTLPLPSYVLVTNLDNHRQAVVRVNDRGPFHDDRIIDLSYAAAQKLCVVRNGTARVEVEAIDPDSYTGRLVASTGGTRSKEAPLQDSPPDTTVARVDDELGDTAGVVIPSAAAATTIQMEDGDSAAPAAPAATASAATTASAPTHDLPPAGQSGGFIVEGESSEAVDPNLHKVNAPRATAPVANDDVLLQSPVPSTSGSLYLQVGAFSQQANAEALADRLRKAGLTQVRISPPETDGPIRVRLGPYADADAMETDRQRLDELDIPARSVRE